MIGMGSVRVIKLKDYEITEACETKERREV